MYIYYQSPLKNSISQTLEQLFSSIYINFKKSFILKAFI